MVVSELLQVVAVVTSWVLLSENDAVAVYCCVVPLAMLADGGVTLRPLTTAAVTVSVVEADWLPVAAVICALPMAAPWARPCEPLALLIVAIEVSDEVQLTAVVRSCVLPSV